MNSDGPFSSATIDHIATLSESERRAFVLSRPTVLGLAIVQQLADAVRVRLRVNVREAHALAETACLIAQQLGTDVAMAWALRARANARWFMNDLRTAVELFESAARLFEHAGNPAEMARTLSSSIQSLMLIGEYERAELAASRAREVFSFLGDEHRLARLDVNVANLLHRQDRLPEALDRYKEAYSRLLAFHDAEGIAAVLHNMAVVLIGLDDFDQAMAAYEQAREHCGKAGMPLIVAQADYNIAYLYYFRGEYSTALERLKSTRLACIEVGDAYHAALCTLDQSEIYLDLALSRDAAEMAAEAEQAFARLGNRYETARAMTNRAIALGQQGDAHAAIALFRGARPHFEREGNAVWPALIDLYLAFLLCQEGKHAEARQLALAAAPGFDAARIRRKAVLCHLLLARIDLRTGFHQRALRYCEQALADIHALDAPALDYEAYFLRGQVEEATGDVAAAYRSYQSARDRLEALRSLLWGEDLKIAFMKTKVEVYERLVDLCLQDHERHERTSEIFGYIEQSKSRSLRDLFFARHAMGAHARPRGERWTHLKTLRNELNWSYRRVEHEQFSREEGSDRRLEVAQAQLKSREDAFIRLLREIPSEQPDDIVMGSAAVVGVADVRTALRPRAILVEYFRTGERVLAAVLTTNRLDVVPVTTVSRLKQITDLLLFQLTTPQLPSEHLSLVEGWPLKSTQVHLRELHAELIAPLRLPRGSELVIIPHELLHRIPFHALHDGDEYLIDSHQISYAPSAAIYKLCCDRRIHTGGDSLILGVPDARAPFILEEVQAVAGAVANPRLLIGAAATASALRERGSASEIIHIATHGYFREDNPLFSRIRLGDGYLTLYDLYALHLPADLIALSGCETGLNVADPGDELGGLVRGLLSAGARSVLLALWNVHDRSAARFMEVFYRSRQSGRDKATSVRNAMIELRNKYPHPYHWAPFVLMGAPD
jgi:CHAT domain-containing protein